MGVTTGWIDEETLERKWIVLACKRITGKHSFDILGKHLMEIIKDAKLEGKIQMFVTDGAKNLSKMFR
jgi:hypothetical protein